MNSTKKLLHCKVRWIDKGSNGSTSGREVTRFKDYEAWVDQSNHNRAFLINNQGEAWFFYLNKHAILIEELPPSYIIDTTHGSIIREMYNLTDIHNLTKYEAYDEQSTDDKDK